MANMKIPSQSIELETGKLKGMPLEANSADMPTQSTEAPGPEPESGVANPMKTDVY
jgi:hypothetical protein